MEPFNGGQLIEQEYDIKLLCVASANTLPAEASPPCAQSTELKPHPL